jgi:hypothetical protein
VSQYFSSVYYCLNWHSSIPMRDNHSFCTRSYVFVLYNLFLFLYLLFICFSSFFYFLYVFCVLSSYYSTVTMIHVFGAAQITAQTVGRLYRVSTDFHSPFLQGLLHSGFPTMQHLSLLHVESHRVLTNAF